MASALVEDDVTSYVTERGTRQLGGNTGTARSPDSSRDESTSTSCFVFPNNGLSVQFAAAIGLTGAITYVMLRTDELD